MEFLLEMLFTAALALFFSFLVAKLVSISMAGNAGRNDLCSDQVEEETEIAFANEFVMEEVCFPMKMDARELQSERNFRVVDENVESVDRFGNEADPVLELQETITGNRENRSGREELVVLTAEALSTAAVSSGIVIADEIIVRGNNEQGDSAEEIGIKSNELMVPTASVSPGNRAAEEIMSRGQQEQSETTEIGRSDCVENEENGGDVVVAEPEEVRIEESNTVEKSDTKEEENEEKEEVSIEESNTVDESDTKEEDNAKKEELTIEDDWEGIERSELEKAFADAAKYLEESGKGEEIDAEAKMELYGLHKIATEGSCREAQPLAVMVSARAKWNAWQKLGNMSQEEAMEQYLALVSKEIPGLMYTGQSVGKTPDIATSVVEPPNSGSLEDPTTLTTTDDDESSKNGKN